jgi:hypothetical protein
VPNYASSMKQSVSTRQAVPAAHPCTQPRHEPTT